MATSLQGNSGFSNRTGASAGKAPTGYQHTQLSNFTPEQSQLFQHLLGQLGPDSYTSRLAGGDQSLFQEQEAPALRQFSALQGNISSRFSGQGLGGRRSSGFQNASNQAASDFAQDLQSRRQGLQRQAIQDLLGMGNQLLGQRQFENVLTPEQKPWWQELLSSLAGGAGQAAGGLGSIYGAKKLGIF